MWCTSVSCERFRGEDLDRAATATRGYEAPDHETAARQYAVDVAAALGADTTMDLVALELAADGASGETHIYRGVTVRFLYEVELPAAVRREAR